MLDFIRFWVQEGNVQDLLGHELLYKEFNMKVARNTGEIKSDQANYRDMKFTIKQNKHIEISGSFHKYAQNGSSYMNYSFTEMSNTIMKFCQTFNINPYRTTIKSFELGVNLNKSPRQVINSIVVHKTRRPNINTYKGRGYSKIFEHQQYIYRIYDKAAKDEVEGEILRVEYKIEKMAVIEKAKMYSLVDLLNLNKWRQMKVFITTPIKDMIFAETIDSDSLTESERVLYLNGQTPEFWINLNTQNKEQFKYQRKLYRNLIGKYGNHLQASLIKSIEAKCNEMLETSEEQLRSIYQFLEFYESPTTFGLPLYDLEDFPQINY